MVAVLEDGSVVDWFLGKGHIRTLRVAV